MKEIISKSDSKSQQKPRRQPKQLNLFERLSSLTNRYRYQIEAVPPDERTDPDRLCRLRDKVTGELLREPRTYPEAVEILKSTSRAGGAA